MRSKSNPLVLLLLASSFRLIVESGTTKTSANSKHRFKQLTSRRTRSVAECSTIDPLFQYDLPPILKPRVPGTESHREVKEYIESRLKQLGPRWEVTLDTFSTQTPLGQKSFTNVVATLDPHVDRRLVLSAHYDSKIIDGSFTKFLGATDSALPCALLLDLAHSLNSKLQTRKLEHFSLQLIFFDGEEAFVRWSEKDSIYGSRHLVEQMSHINGLLSVGNKTGLQAMEVLVLLDLIGAENPTFPNFFEATSDMHGQFVKIEERLDKLGHLASHFRPYFPMRKGYGQIQDDHIPFLRKGVAILHLISYPFPGVWHKPSDNLAALHMPTISNLRKIFLVFLHEYFNLK